MASKEARVEELNTLIEANDFWQDADRAQQMINESNHLKAWTVLIKTSKKGLRIFKLFYLMLMK